MTYPKTMYRVKQYGFGIEAVEIVKETEKCVWLQKYTWGNPPTPIPGKSQRELKTKYNKFYDDFGSAKTDLVEQCSVNIENLKRSLIAANEKLKNAMSITEATQ